MNSNQQWTKSSLGIQAAAGRLLATPIELSCSAVPDLAAWQKGVARNVEWNFCFPFPAEETSLRVVLFADAQDDVSPSYCPGTDDPAQIEFEELRVIGYSSPVDPDIAGWLAAGWACAWQNKDQLAQLIKDLAGVEKKSL